MSKRLRDLVAYARDLGLDVQPGRKHLRVLNRDGRQVAILPLKLTDHQGRDEFKATLRRAARAA